MPDQTHVYFIASDFGEDPGVVTALIGTEPTRAYRKGDLMPNTSHGVRYRDAGWVLDSPLSVSAHADEHLEALVQLLEMHAEGVRRVSDQYDAGIQCAVYYEDFNPGIHLSRDIIVRTGTLGLWVDFDLYFLGKDDREEEA